MASGSGPPGRFNGGALPGPAENLRENSEGRFEAPVLPVLIPPFNDWGEECRGGMEWKALRSYFSTERFDLSRIGLVEAPELIYFLASAKSSRENKLKFQLDELAFFDRKAFHEFYQGMIEPGLLKAETVIPRRNRNRAPVIIDGD